MMRFLVSLLVIHFSITALTGCTTSSDSSDETGAIEEEADDSGDTQAEAESDVSDEEEGEFEESEEPAQETAQNEDQLEDELSADDKAVEPKKEEAGPVEKEVTDDVEPEAPVVAEKVEEQPTEELSEEVVEAPAEPVVEKTQIKDIRYLANSNGGTVVIESNRPVGYQTRTNPETHQFIIEIADAELPANLKRPYPMGDFANSRFASINAYQSPGSSTARVVVQLAGPLSGDPIIQQEGTSLVVVPPALPPPTVATSAPPAEREPPRSSSALAAKSLSDFLTGNQKFYGRPISLQVKDSDIRDVINFLAEESGANIVMSDEVSGKISLKLRKIPWDQALVTVMRAKELGYVRQGNVIRVSTLKSLQSETDSANRLIEAQKNATPAVVRVLPVSYASLDDLVKNLAGFLTKDGKLVADNRTSTIVVTDKADAVERVTKLIKTLDVAPAQVSIESKVVEAIESFSSFIGVNWGFTGFPVQLSTKGGAYGGPVAMNAGLTGSSFSSAFGASTLATSLNVGTLDFFGDLSATLALAEKDSLAKVISAPRISTMNREKASITQEGEIISIVTTRSETTGSVTKAPKSEPFKLELAVTPQITTDGGVIMDMEVKREFPGAIEDEETRARPKLSRSAKTKVLVRNGQTAVIGGIYSSDDSESHSGVPGLSKIPVLGWLFKSKSVNRQKNELLIFMTPRVLNETMGAAEASVN